MDGDNAVKYQSRTLQLLRALGLPSYAGVKVEVLEQSDGRLTVQHGGNVIAHQEATPKAGALCASSGAHGPILKMAQVVRNLIQCSLTRSQLRHLPALGSPVYKPTDDENSPTVYALPPRQAAPCKASPVEGGVARQAAGCLSRRGIAKKLDISGTRSGIMPGWRCRPQTGSPDGILIQCLRAT